MARATTIPLALGGHSFIGQLGSDAPASEEEQRLIVETCLDAGIVWFDTTYLPERVALGHALRALGRREEAAILAWNFFTSFAPGDPVGPPERYRPHHIDQILAELQTSYVDVLVLVPVEDRDENRRQRELAIEWRNKGYARALGLWIADPAVMDDDGSSAEFRYSFRPYNTTTPEAASLFAACKARGWETFATSPFFRGWELDRTVALAAAQGHGPPEALRPVIADLMLRHALFQPHVDRVIVAMRKLEWVARNLESVARGPLTVGEIRRLDQFRVTATNN